jgi:hypothetical protein
MSNPFFINEQTFMLKGFTELSADDQSTVKQLMASHVPAIKSEPAGVCVAQELGLGLGLG